MASAITPKRASELGLSRSGLYRSAKAGRLERVARGIYLSPEDTASDWDWIAAAARRPDATICLTSALAYYDLTDAIPDALDIAIPRGSRIPAGAFTIRWHLFARDTFHLGREEIQIPGSEQTIGIYSPERCIADAFRLRANVGYELGRDALREWLRKGGKPAGLIELASRLPRARKPLLQALEALT